LAESIVDSNPDKSAVLYFKGCAPAGMGLADRHSIETKRAAGA